MKNEQLKVGFVYDLTLEDRDGRILDKWTEKNLIPQAELAIMLRAAFGEATPFGLLYIGLYGNNTLPSSASTAADIPTVLGEFTQYTQADRPLWQRTFDGDGSYSNNTNKAEFTFQVDKLIHGLFMSSVPDKASGGGRLVSVAKLNTPRLIYAGTTLKVAASITYLTNSN